MAVITTTKDKNYGEPLPYDPDFRGPLAHRSCTDVIFLFLFIVFIGVWIGVGTYAYTNGDPYLLLAPQDSRGKRCGIDAGVVDKPYLVFFDLSQCIRAIPFGSCRTPQVCVAGCPDKPFSWDLVGKTAQFNPDDMICQEGIKPKSIAEAATLVKEEKCAQYYLPSTSVLNRCLYNEINGTDAIKIQNVNVTLIQDHFSYLKVLSQIATKHVITVFTANESILQTATKIVNDITSSWKQILGYCILTLILSILVIALLRWFAGILTWISILGIIALLSFVVYCCAMKYKSMLDNLNQTEERPHSLRERFSDYFNSKTTWLVLLIVSSVVLLILILLLIFLRKRIVLAIAIFEETSKSVLSNFSSLFFPIFPWIFQMLFIIYAVFIGLHLASMGEGVYKIEMSSSSQCICIGEAASYKNGSICKPDHFNKFCRENGQLCETASCHFRVVNQTNMITYLQGINVFGFFWSLFIISAFGEIVLAGTFATWYWTFKKSKAPFFGVINSMMRALRFHIGTLAFGSLILTICRIIRVILEYLDSKLNKCTNIFVKPILCCCKCFFWCLEKFIKFVNKNAYIMCAIHGKNFCTSAKDAFNLLMRNIVRVLVVNKVTDFLIFINKLLIAGGSMTIAYYVTFRENYTLNYIWTPIIMIGLFSYFISSIFFSVYSMGVDTLFLCFLEDTERNDGSEEKPYYMSKNLMRILGKRNKMS